ncbi:M48 family metalloprotease [Undibacterium sp. TJN19]|uniref:M48 family metalloprotease n=1 Tax=Undibacterium sp. TJN19 TaxID=3413055 RepID=UPI003BF12710
MDFFEQQDQAHRQSRKLLFLFFLAVVAIIVTVNFALAMIWIWTSSKHFAGAHSYPRGFFFINTVVTLLFIGGGTLVEMYRLRDGGDAVAQMAGGRLVMPSSQDTQERRLLNIVEEMALAAGIACPRVYILDSEDAINAFAAGYHQNEAVVAVTRGTLTRLTRDELQGVIGHEFSHILNGDMRMNIKLIGVLFGIQMIAGFGQELLYWGSRFGSSRSSDEKGPSFQLIMLAFGAALFVIGYVGIFFGRLIKSAVSRQREFLADASAVQFTRNPDGIGGALRKIGGLTRVNDCGSRINHPKAEQFSHMFLGAAKPHLLSGLFATHPPLQERLRRVYGKSVEFTDASVVAEAAAPVEMPAGVSGFNARDAYAGQQGLAQPARTTGRAVQASAPDVISGAGFGLQTNQFSKQAAGDTNNAFSLNALIVQAARDTSGACALLYALLLDRSQADAYALQLQILQQAAAGQAELAEKLLAEIETMSRGTRLPMLDLAMPALRLLSTEQKNHLLSVVNRLIAADQRITQAEFVLQTVLERRLGNKAGRSVAVRYSGLSELKNETRLLLSLVAHGQPNDSLALPAFRRAAVALPDLKFSDADMRSAASLDFFEISQALEKLNQLAPLAKPFLIRGMLAAAIVEEKISDDMADLLRGVCAALDAPVPDQVSAVYASVH